MHNRQYYVSGTKQTIANILYVVVLCVFKLNSK